jgi:cyclic-di-GMP-binding biofilm dispersal mediator protein
VCVSRNNETMTTLQGKRILVVGASGAFGREFCNQLMAQGAEVFGTARTNETSVRLGADLAGRLILDLESAESINNLATYLRSLPEGLDGIVLAAGLVAFGSIAETPGAVTEKLLKVNALGQIQLASQLLDKLVQSAEANREPFVLSISGVIAETPMAGLSSYSASKTALLGYAQAAAKELRKSGVSWIDARPGHTESGLASRAVFGTAPNFGAGKDVATVVARMISGIVASEKDLPSSAF